MKEVECKEKLQSGIESIKADQMKMEGVKLVGNDGKGSEMEFEIDQKLLHCLVVGDWVEYLVCPPENRTIL